MKNFFKLINYHFARGRATLERVVVELVSFKGAWVAQPVGGGDVLFVRKSSLRDRAQWPELRAGSRVSLAIRRVAGRGIVSDAVLE